MYKKFPIKIYVKSKRNTNDKSETVLTSILDL